MAVTSTAVSRQRLPEQAEGRLPIAAGMVLLAVGAIVMAAAATPQAQADNPLLRRWVGTHQRQTLHLDFYGDTMLVVNDAHVLDFVATQDSIIAFGDTSFAVHYRFALGRLLLRTVEGNVITMAPQPALARPLFGHWLGTPNGNGQTRIELWMRANGTALWRETPGGTWTNGEWDRTSRIISFTWFPDSVAWSGLYDPGGNSLLLEETTPEFGSVILRRFFR